MDRVCPLLGLAVDRRVVVDGVDGSHRCHAESPPGALEHAMQAQRCLTPAHERCERLLAYQARGGALPGSGPGAGLVATRLILTPEPAWRGIAGRARRARRAPFIAAAAASLGLGAATVALGAAVLDGRIQIGRAVGDAPLAGSPTGGVAPGTSIGTGAPDATVSASVPAGPTRSVAPAATATAAPTPTMTPVPATVGPATPVPETPVPATPAPPPATYTVIEGDTLASIAQRFGTTVGALQDLNGIDDPDEIVIGQVLALP